MSRRDIQPAYYSMPTVPCPSCDRVGKLYKLHGDLGVLYGCGYDDCSYHNFLAWSDLDALKAKAS